MRLVKRLDIFVLRNFLTLLCGTFVICLFVVMMQFLWKFVDDLVGKGLAAGLLVKFFFYAAETLVPLALPLAVLLAALISFGNMGERLELLAIKAAGISLVRTLRPIALLMIVTTAWSFYFQNVTVPTAQNKLMTMLYSMRQKSPELDIPEGVFYDGVEGMNLFVQRKDKETGMLYGCIIYNMSDGVRNAHILLADSGRLETSADKLHLLLHLWSGEQFENLQTNALSTKNVPYRRETFVRKLFIIDFDQNFEMQDADFSGSARTKGIRQLRAGADSLVALIDSNARSYYADMERGTLYVPRSARPQGFVMANTSQEGIDRSQFVRDSTAKAFALRTDTVPFDTLVARLPMARQHDIVQRALQKATTAGNDLEYRVEIMQYDQRNLNRHKLEIWQKVTLALACLVFFFIGAPLGAIIRKGGLGFPVVVAVVIFIFYYLVNTFGKHLATTGIISPMLGMWFSTMVLTPIGIFLTVKSNNDSVVFNWDTHAARLRRLWGVQPKRHIQRKEVIIHDPDYGRMACEVRRVAEMAAAYRHSVNLVRLPNYIKVFFTDMRDERIDQLSQALEASVETLSNSKDRAILLALNALPVLDPHAHTAPFTDRRLNRVAGVLLPVGVLLLLRITRFRRRLRRDLKTIGQVGTKIALRCEELSAQNSPCMAVPPEASAPLAGEPHAPRQTENIIIPQKDTHE